MQDPPGLIPEMFRLWKEGYDVVLPQRRSRTGEPWLKILTARVAYAVIHRISEVQIPPNTGDFRLISRKVVDQLLMLNESHGFIRGMVALVGFRQKLLPFDRPPRFSGQTNYNHLVGSVRIGINGLLCFSRVPVNWIFLIGALMCALGFSGAALSLCFWLAGWGNHQEFLLLLSCVCAATGIQLIGLGVLGQYVVRIYDEVKIRPKYIVESTVGIVKEQAY
jgi:dolichol-phosphate mannosyltransferase